MLLCVFCVFYRKQATNITPLKNRISLLHECFAVDYQQDALLLTFILKD